MKNKFRENVKNEWLEAAVVGDLKKLKKLTLKGKSNPDFDINAWNDDYQTALTLSCIHGFLDSVIFLVKNGASIIRCHDVKEHFQAIKVYEAINTIN